MHMINQGGFFWIDVLNLVGSRHEWRPLSTSIKKWFISIVAGFAFISREYISEHLPMTASETQKDIFNNHNVYDKKSPHRIGLRRYLMNRSSRLLLIFFILIWQNCPEKGRNSCSFNPIQDEGAKKHPPYQFFPCNFYKCRNQPPKLSDF